MVKKNLLKISSICMAFLLSASSSVFDSQADEGETSPDTGASYFDYQWGLKNNGSFQMITESLVPVTRAPGEERNFGEGWGSGWEWIFGWRFGWGGMDFTIQKDIIQSVQGVDINIEPAWNYYEQSTTRRPVTVAIIDSGVDITHSELAGSIWTNADEVAGDGVDNDSNGYIDDVNGWNFYENSNTVYRGSEDDHGTHGAGTIAAAWNQIGVSGIADSAYVKIMPLKIFGSEDSTANFDAVKAAIRYAEANGAQICNLSIGTSSYDQELGDIIASSSMLFVISAGNGDYYGNGYDIDYWPVYPAAYSSDNIISVANLMFDGTLEESSNYGSGSVDIAAPGTYILSTTAGGGYEFMSGTSMSAPMVTGVAALVYSCRTDMSIMDVRTAILSTAKRTEGLTGWVSSGGMVDAYAAITYGLGL